MPSDPQQGQARCEWCKRDLPKEALTRWPGGIGCKDEDACEAAIEAKGTALSKLVAMVRRLVN